MRKFILLFLFACCYTVCNKTHAYNNNNFDNIPTNLGIKLNLSNTNIIGLTKYPTKEGYKTITDFSRLFNFGFSLLFYADYCVNKHIARKIEVGFEQWRGSVKIEKQEEMTKQQFKLMYNGFNTGMVLYVYPKGRYADSGALSLHVGGKLNIGFYNPKLKEIPLIIKDNIGLYCAPLCGIGFEFPSGIEVEVRYSLGFDLITKEPKTRLHNISLGISYPLLKS